MGSNIENLLAMSDDMRFYEYCRWLRVVWWNL